MAAEKEALPSLESFLLRTVASLAVCGAALWCANSVVAKQVEATEAEKAIVAQIKCEDL